MTPLQIEMLFDQPVPRQGVRRFGARKVSIERIAVLSLEVRDDDVGVSDLRAVAVDDVGKLAVRRVLIDPREVLCPMFEFEPGERHVGKDLGHVWADVDKPPGRHVAIDRNHSVPQSAEVAKQCQ